MKICGASKMFLKFSITRKKEDIVTPMDFFDYQFNSVKEIIEELARLNGR